MLKFYVVQEIRENAFNHDSASASREMFMHRLRAKPLKIEDSKSKHNPFKALEDTTRKTMGKGNQEMQTDTLSS